MMNILHRFIRRKFLKYQESRGSFDMEFRNLKSFIKVAGLGSFSKAAEQLGYNQSSVTVQIQKLEEELGVKLFDRIGKKVYLTPAGQTLYTSALKITQEVNAAITSVTRVETELKGVLRIGCIDSIANSIMVKLLQTYCQEHPGVQFVLDIGTIDEMLPLLKRDELDIACTFDHLVSGDEWVKMVAIPETIVCIGTIDYQFDSTVPVYQHPLLLTETGTSYRKLLEEELAKLNIQVHPKIESGNTELILQLVKNGVGLTFLPHYCLEASPFRDRLQIIPTNFAEMSLHLQVIQHRDKTTTATMAAFIKSFQEWCQQ